MPTNNTYTPRKTAWDCTWSAFGLGTTYEVTPDLKLTLEPIKRGTTGKIILGHWIVGLEGAIKVQLADVTRAAMEALTPWWTVGASIPIHPGGLSQNLYDYAQLLKLHPRDLAASDTTQDLNFPKTTPMTPVNIKRAGEKDDLWEVHFQLYPDLSKLQAGTPSVVYGWVGPVVP